MLHRASGLGALAATYLLSEDHVAGATKPVNPLAPKPPHFAPKAKSVIWLFMAGGPSHIDLFDPKPLLDKLAGKPMPPSFVRPAATANGTAENALLPSKRTWKQYGHSGLWVSDWLPDTAELADDLCVLRSCTAKGINHSTGMSEMNTGDILSGRPSLGSWVTYGLGAANQDLPAYVVLTDDKDVAGGPKNWGTGFLPVTYQGTAFRGSGPPILHLARPEEVGDKQQRRKLDLLAKLNEFYDADKPEDTELEARLQTYELAYRMQSSAPEAIDLSVESDATRKLYGMDDEVTARMGRNCLLARRLVERNVRFIEVFCGTGGNGAWDAHDDIEGNHTKTCKMSDKPVAGLLKDLKARGLLESTLVIWGGEFGRTPFYEAGKGKKLGRDHNPWGFTIWMAGAGVKAGTTVGSTDEIGFRAQENPCDVHDVHATILHLMGLNHLNLTYMHNGRAERPTMTGGRVIEQILA
jgi:hypothetical protein